jgi:hypothetical protein
MRGKQVCAVQHLTCQLERSWKGDGRVKFSKFTEAGRRNSRHITEGVEWGTQIAEIGAENAAPPGTENFVHGSQFIGEMR